MIPIPVKPHGTQPGTTNYGLGDPLNDPIFWITEGIILGSGIGITIGLLHHMM
jgi:hypothetical protein